jgi:hypothetical protein
MRKAVVSLAVFSSFRYGKEEEVGKGSMYAVRWDGPRVCDADSAYPILSFHYSFLPDNFELTKLSEATHTAKG